MKRRDIAQLLTVAFLFLLFVAGSISLFQSTERYGWVYEETVTIADVSETRIVDGTGSAVSLLFLLWLIFLLLPKRASVNLG